MLIIGVVLYIILSTSTIASSCLASGFVPVPVSVVGVVSVPVSVSTPGSSYAGPVYSVVSFPRSPFHLLPASVFVILFTVVPFNETVLPIFVGEYLTYFVVLFNSVLFCKFLPHGSFDASDDFNT